MTFLSDYSEPWYYPFRLATSLVIAYNLINLILVQGGNCHFLLLELLKYTKTTKTNP